jgi:hypothetical protein
LTRINTDCFHRYEKQRYREDVFEYRSTDSVGGKWCKGCVARRPDRSDEGAGAPKRGPVTASTVTSASPVARIYSHVSLRVGIWESVRPARPGNRIQLPGPIRGSFQKVANQPGSFGVIQYCQRRFEFIPLWGVMFSRILLTLLSFSSGNIKPTCA